MRYLTIIFLLISVNSQAQIIRAQPFYVVPTCTGLLLDCYPNAAAAYALRKLNSSYTGNCIEVRRSSDNTTLNIGFTASGDLDTATLKTFVGANNGFIKTFYDQSGNGRNFTQTTNANQPRIISSGTIDRKNGKPSLFFNGSYQMSVASSTATFSFLHKSGISYVFGVVQFGTVANPLATFMFLDNNGGFTNSYTGYTFYYSDGASSNDAISIGTTKGGSTVATNIVANIGATDAALPNKLNLFTNKMDNANSDSSKRCYLYVNNSLNAATNTYTNNPSTGNATTNLTLGASFTSLRLIGYISECIIYNSDQTPNVNKINLAINSYYSIF